MRTDTTVRDVMHREFLGASESDALSEAAALMADEETDCLVVVRGGESVGRLTSRDALVALLDERATAGRSGPESDDDSLPAVGDVMGPPLPAVAPDDALAAVEELLVAEGVDRVVAVDDGETVGVVTAADVLAAGAPRTGAGAGDFGAGPASGDGPLGETVVSAGATADSDAERGVEATIDPDVTTGATSDVTEAQRDGDAPAAVETRAPSDAPTQGVCENCGALVPDLVSANGQAVCPNCREI